MECYLQANWENPQFFGEVHMGELPEVLTSGGVIRPGCFLLNTKYPGQHSAQVDG